MAPTLVLPHPSLKYPTASAIMGLAVSALKEDCPQDLIPLEAA